MAYVNNKNKKQSYIKQHMAIDLSIKNNFSNYEII